MCIDPDWTPAGYHLYSKYLDRQAGAISIDPDWTPAEYIYILSIWTGRQGLYA